jgi:hypothetical protein
VAGAALSYGGLALEALALGLAPLSLVQSVIAAGQVVVAGGSRWATGTHATRREVAGTALMVLALCTLAAGLPAAGGGPKPGVGAFLAFEAGAAALGIALCGRGRGARRLALGAGVFYGATTAALAGLIGGIPAAAIPVGIVVTAAGFFAFQRSLQAGRPVAAVTLMTAGTSAVAIAGGLIAFGNPLGSGPLANVVDLVAFALVPAAAVLAGGGAAVLSDRPAPAGAAPGTPISPAPPRWPRAAQDRVA